jgi:hypothetical protein
MMVAIHASSVAEGSKSGQRLPGANRVHLLSEAMLSVAGIDVDEERLATICEQYGVLSYQKHGRCLQRDALLLREQMTWALVWSG